METSVKDVKARLWQVRFQQFKAGGRSVAEFCDSVGCSPNTFYYWKKKLGSSIDLMRGPSPDASTHRKSPKSSAFVPLVVKATPAQNVVMHFSDGSRIEIDCDPVSALQAILNAKRAS